MRSIRRQLLVWLLAGLSLAILGAAIGTYLRARDEANALFDYQLKEMAASLTDAPFAGVPSGASSTPPGPDTLVVQIWDRNGVQLFMSQPRRVLPQHAQLGFTTISTDSGEWRIFSTLSGGQVVQVAQPMTRAAELAASLAFHDRPLLAVLPFLVILIWFTIARGLSPLERVAADVGRRSPTALEPLAEANMPREVQPLVMR
jgi:two-component system OmpR family sensor kinase